MKFKVKRHWWMWALWGFFALLAIRFLMVGMSYIFYIFLAVSFAFIFSEASDVSYEIINRQFTVKRIIYYDISFPCDAITSVEKATLFVMKGGFAAQFYTESFGSYKITYSTKSTNRQRKAVIVSPKDKTAFLSELRLHIDPKLILIDNTESVFKKKKDEV